MDKLHENKSRNHGIDERNTTGALMNSSKIHFGH